MVVASVVVTSIAVSVVPSTSKFRRGRRRELVIVAVHELDRVATGRTLSRSRYSYLF